MRSTGLGSRIAECNASKFLANLFSDYDFLTPKYPQYLRVVPELEILTILPDLTLNFVTLIGRPQCNGRYCWQASLFHLLPKFTRTVKKCGNGNGIRELYFSLLTKTLTIFLYLTVNSVLMWYILYLLYMYVCDYHLHRWMSNQ